MGDRQDGIEKTYKGINIPDTLEHITDGTLCWCNPRIISYTIDNVEIEHRYETLQQGISQDSRGFICYKRDIPQLG